MSKHDPFNTHLVTCAKPESAVSLYLSRGLYPAGGSEIKRRRKKKKIVAENFGGRLRSRIAFGGQGL